MGDRPRSIPSVLALFGLLPVSAAAGNIDLELRPMTQTAAIGETVEVGLYAVSDDETVQLLSVIQAIIAWEPAVLELLGNNGDGAVTLLSSGFPAGDPFNLNETVPPQDGDGIYVAWAPIGSGVGATPDGVLITTFEFLALAPAAASPVAFLETAGEPPTDTIVFDGTVPNFDVTGTLTGATVQVQSCCAADLDGDCMIGIQEFLIVLGNWGPCPDPPQPCLGDINRDNQVGIEDFLIVLGLWGPCP